MTSRDELFKKDLEYKLNLLKRVGYLENKVNDQYKHIQQLEEENKKLKYEYPDSKRKRDVALPYKWAKKGVHLLMFCPKCGMGIANWYRYCNACGQKIKQGNPLPEMEKRTEEEENG